MPGFTLEDDALDLPPGAIARTERKILRHDGRPVLGLTQGRMRPYVYPLFTPKGFAVTSESPADHPHHNSLWIASDHVHALVPVGAGKHEEYTYNFYVDETFQGRAPGTLIAGAPALESSGGASATIDQHVEWRGPSEWGAPQGRIVATERRRTTVAVAAGAHMLDVESELSATAWELAVGPTRHAYFNVRVADSMVVSLGGDVRDDRGRHGAAALAQSPPRWVDFTGPVGGGQVAGVTVIPDPRDADDVSWFVADWGVVSVGTFRLKRRVIARGDKLRVRFRAVVHDGTAADTDIAAWVAGFPA